MSNFDKPNSQLSLKNVDAAKVAQALTEHQNSLIKIVLIIGTLLLVGLMFNNLRIKDQDLCARMSQIQDKVGVIKTRGLSIQRLDDFKAALPKKLNELELISLISNFASVHNITISSLSPAESKDMGLYDVINITFDATCSNFKDMVLFLRKIEKSNYPLRVDSWSGYEMGNGNINFKIEISAVIIHT